MKILKENNTQKEKFRLVANKLLNGCFIVKKKEDSRNDYIFVTQNKEIFNEYFDLLGYKVEINDIQGVIALTSMSGTGRLHLNKTESILILILRLLFIEKCKELSLSDSVIILSDEIHQKYNMLKLKVKPTLEKTVFRESIKLFKRYNLIDLIDRDIIMSDARIKIYPSILLAVPNDNLTAIYEKVNEKLEKYMIGGEQSEDEEIM